MLSNNDGCVIARSNEAKALGVDMGADDAIETGEREPEVVAQAVED